MSVKCFEPCYYMRPGRRCPAMCDQSSHFKPMDSEPDPGYCWKPRIPVKRDGNDPWCEQVATPVDQCSECKWWYQSD